jgi:predicted ATPase
MAVFRGGFDRQAAGQVADASLTVLTTLIDKSLIRLEEHGRYDMHTLLRQFAEEQLASTGELNVIKDAHLDYFLHLACLAEEYLLGSTDQAKWMKTLQEDHHNLQIAIRRALDIDQVESAARIVSSLWRYWHLSGRVSEGRGWVKIILTHEAKLSKTSQARVHFTEGVLAWHQGMYSQARTHLEISVILWQALDDKSALAYAMTMLGFVLDY